VLDVVALAQFAPTVKAAALLVPVDAEDVFYGVIAADCPLSRPAGMLFRNLPFRVLLPPFATPVALFLLMFGIILELPVLLYASRLAS
jgi:hypothetical protein